MSFTVFLAQIHQPVFNCFTKVKSTIKLNHIPLLMEVCGRVCSSDQQVSIVELLRHKILQIEVEAWNLAQIYLLPF